MKTVITLCRNDGSPNTNIKLDFDDATTEAIAQAAIDLIASSMSLSEGNVIYVTQEG
jgi:hypothetical protein